MALRRPTVRSRSAPPYSTRRKCDGFQPPAPAAGAHHDLVRGPHLGPYERKTARFGRSTVPAGQHPGAEEWDPDRTTGVPGSPPREPRACTAGEAHCAAAFRQSRAAAATPYRRSNTPPWEMDEYA